MAVTVRNKTISGLARRLARASEELHHCGSANNQEFEAADAARQKMYLDDVINYLNYAQDSKPLDQPKARPQEFSIPDPVKYPLVASEVVNDLQQMLYDLEIETIHCPSNTRAGGLNEYDDTRLRAAVDSAKDFIMNYAEVFTPLDYTETEPSRALVGQGKSGAQLGTNS